MGAVLVTGGSGAGKSSVAAALGLRGLVGLDADADPELARWVDGAGRLVWLPDDVGADWLDRHDWSWDLDRLDHLIAAAPGTLYVCGNAGNVAEAWSRFDRVFLLVIDVPTMCARLDDPARDHDFGRAPGQREWLRGWLPRYQDHMLGLGAIPVDATRPLVEVVDFLV
ncbi:hypothetical protein [Actinokineospora sp. NBRC 105648]|uniref:hypothetical protein n=1 Tax=Actinokineospora sp. NBRC 105648 TaxID=3032206 RepID=UPI00249F9D50|nr:hypothetical protein [Actinokineospora sp. NBRC 105648]GLZ41593.1 hypothetical protein Acsp05_52170 [Actinokineospora sp. NBRC 105648]